MGAACGKGTCVPSPTPSPTKVNLFQHCQACQLRGAVCDLCAASQGPTAPERKSEPAPARTSLRKSFEPLNVECAPTVPRNPDWYDPGFQQAKVKIQPKKLKALREEFDEEDEEDQSKPQVQHTEVRQISPADEFNYPDSSQRGSEFSQQRSNTASVLVEPATQSPTDFLPATEEWENSPVLLQPAPAGHGTQSAEQEPTLQSVLKQLIPNPNALQCLEQAFQNPWEPGKARDALNILAQGGAPELGVCLAKQPLDWQNLLNAGLTAIIDAVLLPLLQAVAASSPKSLEQLAGAVRKELAEAPGLGIGVRAAVQSMSAGLWLEGANELCMLASSVVASAGVVMDDCLQLQSKAEAWDELCSMLFGAPLIETPMLVSPSSKAWLLYCSSLRGERLKLNLRVRRGYELQDALAGVQGATDSQCLLFPRFVVGEDGQEEFGEGHGPRKELFGLLLLSLSRAWVVVEGLKEVFVDCGHGEKELENLGSVARQLEVGWKVLFEEAGFEALIVSVDQFSGSLTMDQPSPSTLDMERCTFLRPQKPLLSRSRDTGHLFPSKDLERDMDTEVLFEALGWMVAQSPTNRAMFGAPLSPVMFSFLLGGLPGRSWEPGMEELSYFEPAAHAAILKVCELPPEEFSQFAEMEGFEDGTTVEQYCASSCQELMLRSVEWQLQAFVRGFSRVQGVCDSWNRLNLSAPEAAVMVCGNSGDNTSDFDLRQFFRVSVDDELVESGVADALWRVVDDLAPPQKRALLEFVTGSNVLPAPMSETLSIEQAYAPDATPEALNQRLPCAHTCQNVLEVPMYVADANLDCLLEQRLLSAIEFGKSSYGLDDVRAQELAPPAGSSSPAVDGTESPLMEIMEIPVLAHDLETESYPVAPSPWQDAPEHTTDPSDEEVPARGAPSFSRPDGPEYAPRQDSSMGHHRGGRGGLDDGMGPREDIFGPPGDFGESDSDFDEGLIVSDEESWDGSTMMC